MINKSIFELIDNKYPEINNLKIKSLNEIIKFNNYEKLFQYLIFENTLDSHRRMIVLFHHKWSNIYKFISFFVIIGLYKKEMERIGNPYENLKTSLEVLYHGSFLRFNRINFKDKTFEFYGGIAEEAIQFDDFIFCDPASPSQRKEYDRIYNIVDKYLLNDYHTIEGIFNIPLYKEYKPGSGVIIFTSKGKFDILIKNLSFNGYNISDYMHIQKSIYRKNNSYEYKTISKRKDIPVSILLADYNDIYAIDTFREKYKNLDTIILDDFEGIYYRKKDEVLNLLTNIEVKIKKEELRDIYLIFPDSELDVLLELRKKHINSFPWIIADLDNLNEEGKSIAKILYVEEQDYNHNLTDFYKVKQEIKQLLDQNIFSNDIFTVLRLLTTIRGRYLSYYDPDDLILMLDKAKSLFSKYSEEYLYANIFADIRNVILSFFEQLLNNLSNNKINKILELKLQLNGKTAYISGNTMPKDEEYLESIFKNNDIKVEKYNGKERYDNIIIFDIPKDMKYSIFYNNFANNLFLLFSNQELLFFNKTTVFAKRILEDISSNKCRKILLNLDKNDYFNESKFECITDGLEIIVNNFTPHEQDSPNDDKQPIPGFEEEIRDILSKNYHKYYDYLQKYNKTGITRRDLVIIFFDDGIIIERHPNSKFNVFTEQISDIEKMEKNAKDILVGDEIFLFKNDYDNEDFINLINEKIMLTDKLTDDFYKAEKWRININKLSNYIKINKIKILLYKYGFNITPAMISLWIRGYTSVPDNFDKLIKTLNSISSKEPKYFLDPIESPEEVIRCSKNIRRIKTTIPKLIKEKSIKMLCGIDMEFEDDTTKKLFEEIDKCIDLKKVSHVIRLDHDGNPF